MMMFDGPCPAPPQPPASSPAPAVAPAPLAVPKSSVALAHPASPAVSAASPLALLVPPNSIQTDALRPLLMLQGFDGSWSFEDALFAALGVDRHALAPPDNVQEKSW